MKCLISLFAVFLFSYNSIIAQTPEQLKSWLPEVEGWSISDKTEVFNPDNLFDRINGSAPLFLENNFREMTSMEYTKGDDYITIQAYRHATPEDAFGMYASERSSDLDFLPIGGEAQGDGENMYFFAGNIYVKMSASTSQDIRVVLKQIAGDLANKIDSQATYPLVIKAFPSDGIVQHTTAYITSNYIGHEFLKGVYTSQYDVNNQKFQLFVIDAKDEAGAKAILHRYFTFTKQPLDFSQGYLTIKDRYNGDIPALWKGQYILGIFSENGGTIADAKNILDKLSANLK